MGANRWGALAFEGESIPLLSKNGSHSTFFCLDCFNAFDIEKQRQRTLNNMEPIQNFNNPTLAPNNLQPIAPNTTSKSTSPVNYNYNNAPLPAFDPTVGFRATDSTPPSNFNLTPSSNLESSPVVTSKPLQSVPTKKEQPNHTGAIVAAGATVLGTALLIWKHKSVGKFFSELMGSAKKEVPTSVPKQEINQTLENTEGILSETIPLNPSRSVSAHLAQIPKAPQFTDAQQALKKHMHWKNDLPFSDDGATKIHAAILEFDGSGTGFKNLDDKLQQQKDWYFRDFYAKYGDELLEELNLQDQEALLTHRIRLSTASPKYLTHDGLDKLTMNSRSDLLQAQATLEEQGKLIEKLENLYNTNSTVQFSKKDALTQIKTAHEANAKKIAEQIKHVETMRHNAVKQLLTDKLGNVDDVSEETIAKLLKYHDEGRHIEPGKAYAEFHTDLNYNSRIPNPSNNNQATSNFLGKALPDLMKETKKPLELEELAYLRLKNRYILDHQADISADVFDLYKANPMLNFRKQNAIHQLHEANLDQIFGSKVPETLEAKDALYKKMKQIADSEGVSFDHNRIYKKEGPPLSAKEQRSFIGKAYLAQVPPMGTPDEKMEAISKGVNFYKTNRRSEEGLAFLDDAIQGHPDQKSALDALKASLETEMKDLDAKHFEPLNAESLEGLSTSIHNNPSLDSVLDKYLGVKNVDAKDIATVKQALKEGLAKRNPTQVHKYLEALTWGKPDIDLLTHSLAYLEKAKITPLDAKQGEEILNYQMMLMHRIIRHGKEVDGNYERMYAPKLKDFIKDFISRESLNPGLVKKGDTISEEVLNSLTADIFKEAEEMDTTFLPHKVMPQLIDSAANKKLTQVWRLIKEQNDPNNRAIPRLLDDVKILLNKQRDSAQNLGYKSNPWADTAERYENYVKKEYEPTQEEWVRNKGANRGNGSRPAMDKNEAFSRMNQMAKELGLDPVKDSTDEKALKSLYRKLSNLTHPDKAASQAQQGWKVTANQETFKTLSALWEALND